MKKKLCLVVMAIMVAIAAHAQFESGKKYGNVSARPLKGPDRFGRHGWLSLHGQCHGSRFCGI